MVRNTLWTRKYAVLILSCPWKSTARRYFDCYNTFSLLQLVKVMSDIIF
jgi:hypothetical protein